MAAEIHRLRDRAGETEKITINLAYVDLGHIDLLVQEGFYSNRTDFIRTAYPQPACGPCESITVLGALHATKEIKSALADRIR